MIFHFSSLRPFAVNAVPNNLVPGYFAPILYKLNRNWNYREVVEEREVLFSSDVFVAGRVAFVVA